MSDNALLKERAKLQGRIFKRAAQINLDMEEFTSAFMNSEQAVWIDSGVDSIECRGEAYILDDVLADNKINVAKTSVCSCLAQWIGYIYRVWCDSENISSKEAVKKVSFKRMTELYPVLNSMCELRAVEILDRQ